jgi:RHS repeat-associated protein
MDSPEHSRSDQSTDQRFSPPSVSLPKGGGAIKGIGEKFAANPVLGTSSLSLPLPLSSGRSGFTPALSLQYDSGTGNGPYGLGWNVAYPHITRRTDRGLPQYFDAIDSDVFILSGAEDLVPLLNSDGSRFEDNQRGFRIARYRPRIEGLFARIERWTSLSDPANVFWRTISRDNATSIFGTSIASRIADPADPSRIFTWLLAETFDDKGNAALYEYLAEDSRNVNLSSACEQNRTDVSRSAKRYLKTIKYGNRTPRQRQSDSGQLEFLFELIMDYGDHDDANPGINPSRDWPVRPDIFSSYRSGFEVRTYRRCRRFLMFHRFAELGPQPKLVRSLQLDYEDFPYPQGFDTKSEITFSGSTQLGSVLRAVTSSGYADNGLQRSIPPLAFTYSRPQIAEVVNTLEPGSYENLPIGADGHQYRWLDLNGEGIAGVLTEKDDAWWYKPNLGDGQLGAQQLVAQKPAVGSGTRTEFFDLAGDGMPSLVQLDGLNTGFYKRTDTEAWSRFMPFQSQPNVRWGDGNLRFIDLTGDGLADILITEDDVIAWHPGLAEQGFGPRESLFMAKDEAAGPKLVFDDTTETIFLADLSGDGLSDLVRIRYSDVCYWPNLGYGRFGKKIVMDNAPVLDPPELFQPRRVRLADIDGSGTVDLIYLAADGVRIYFNRSGNSLSAAYPLAQFPAIDTTAEVTVTDLLGNGTACLVWSTPLPGGARAPLQYVDLMGGQKPHLLTEVENNLGARTQIDYVSSTKFYLNDKLAGKPWITRLGFPVHVIERVTRFDDVSHNRFVARYAYHHGYFDGVEREFRGFGMVEQFDTEEFASLTANDELPDPVNIDAASYVPPVLTRTWFHTGVYLGPDQVSNFFAAMLDQPDHGEYYREPGLTDEQARQLLLSDSSLPSGLSADEAREAARALKGSMLRQEIYALDGTAGEPHPYTILEQNFSIRLVQPTGGNRNAVFFAHPLESLAFHYEREPADPRVMHALTLAVDDFGNVLQSASVVYGRRAADASLEPEDQAKQSGIHITCGEYSFTNSIDALDHYRTPLPGESQAFELTGLALAGRCRFAVADLAAAISTATQIPFERNPTPAALEKRLIGNARNLYRSDDLTGALALGQCQPLGLVFESYKLAFSENLPGAVYGSKLTAAILEEGGYVHSEGDAQWWIPSGRLFFSANSANAVDSAAAELAEAQAHFFAPRRYRDPFGNSVIVAFDVYDLLVSETSDALGNTVKADYDYRVLQPAVITDANGNRSAASFDALGLVVGTAIMGKANESPRRGDLLDGFSPDLADDVVAAHLADPLADPNAVLQRATSRFIYDLFAYQRTRQSPRPSPAVAYGMVRETHDADLAPGQQTKVQHTFGYSDGFGRELQKKAQAEAGPVPQRDANGGIIVGPDGQPVLTAAAVSLRWVGSGWTIYNNKGKPVRQFEPFFTDRQTFEEDVRIGVSPVIFYDPLARPVATLRPDHSWQKVVFDAWRQESWDVNDTSMIADPKNDADAGPYFARLPETDYLPVWSVQRQGGALGAEEQMAAARTAIHAATPAVAHADALGRTFLTIAHNRFQRSNEPSSSEEFHAARLNLDIEGNERDVVDALDRTVVHYDYDIMGRRIHQASMDAGERWTLPDVSGKPVYAWDTRGHQFHSRFDELRRPSDVVLSENGGAEIVIGRTVYGEGLPTPDVLNLRGKVVQVFDQSGVARTDAYDFKGNPLSGTRQLAQDYKAAIDWSANVPLEADVFASSTSFDALNRPVEHIAPDASRIRHVFNEANLLERVEANLRGETAVTAFVTNIDYDSKGRRTLIQYGNGVETDYAYDPLTLRLTRLRSTRSAALFPDDCPQPPVPDFPGCGVQDLNYTYDPVGNILRIRDDAQQAIYFSNQRVDASSDYVYDAIYRLIEATGREHLGQNRSVPVPDPFDVAQTHLPHPDDGTAMARYVERYVYDRVGNFLSMQHAGNWTRLYNYNEPSLLEPAKQNNRLSSTSVGQVTEAYEYEGPAGLHGDITSMPHLPLMQWDFHDKLQASSRQVAADGAREITWYVYDGSGQRVRKVTELAGGAKKEERAYLGGFEVFRQFTGGAVSLRRESLHVMDGQQRVALVETRTDRAVARTVRYQFGNHLGSAALELDDQAQIISYEDYYPYGSTSYQAGPSQAEVSLKRYRYTGMERDEESGLEYHSARYYAPWLGRWTSCDPIGIEGGLNVYSYCSCNCIKLSDPKGTDPPHDASVTTEVHGTTFKRVEVLDRDDEHAKLITTGDLSTGVWTVTQHLYRGQALRSGHDGKEWEISWTDVTKEAQRSGNLSVDWNMPALDTNKPSPGTLAKVANTLTYLPGETIVAEVPPSLVIPFVKDSILTEHFEFTPEGQHPYTHWADTIGRRWAATGERKTAFWLNKVVTVATTGVAVGTAVNSTRRGVTKILAALKAQEKAEQLAIKTAKQAANWSNAVKEAAKRVAAAPGKYPGNWMASISRSTALTRMESLAENIEEHLGKIAAQPLSRDVPHWQTEIRAWVGEITRLNTHVGKKTGAEWAGRLAGWLGRLNQ